MNDAPDFDRDYADCYIGLSPRESGRLIRDMAAERDRLEAVRRAAAEVVAAEVGSFAWFSAYHELREALRAEADVRAGRERGREFTGAEG